MKEHQKQKGNRKEKNGPVSYRIILMQLADDCLIIDASLVHRKIRKNQLNLWTIFSSDYPFFKTFLDSQTKLCLFKRRLSERSSTKTEEIYHCDRLHTPPSQGYTS